VLLIYLLLLETLLNILYTVFEIYTTFIICILKTKQNNNNNATPQIHVLQHNRYDVYINIAYDVTDK